MENRENSQPSRARCATLGLWGMVGFIVAGCWVILSLAVPISEQPILWGLARVTCLIVPISMALHFGVNGYWVMFSNVVAYALIGPMVEALHQSWGISTAKFVRTLLNVRLP